MKILYIFPHPDDESFGPAGAMSKQVRAGHSVYLLTLTRGGATKQRLKYNYSVKEMGNVRYSEMLNVKKVIGISNMTVLDYPGQWSKRFRSGCDCYLCSTWHKRFSGSSCNPCSSKKSIL